MDRLSAEYWENVQNEVMQRALAYAEQLVSRLIDKRGMAIGDRRLSSEQTLAYVLTNLRSGVLGAMDTIAPKQADRQRAEFREAARRLMGQRDER